MTRGGCAFLIAAAAAFAAPGVSGAWFSGIPVGMVPLAFLAALAFLCWIARRERTPHLARVSIALCALAAVKIALWILAPQTGWIGQYYPNGSFAGQPRRSTEFPRLAGATRIDPAIDFRDDFLPVYFLNDSDFNWGIRREVAQPLAIRWSGVVHSATAEILTLSVERRGRVAVEVDGAAVVNAASDPPATRTLTVAAGDHVVDVRYVKPANTDPLIRVSIGGATVTTRSAAAWRLAVLPAARVAARAVDVLIVVALVVAAGMLARAAQWTPLRAAAAAMLALFIVQGLIAALPSLHHAFTLSGGDDWLAFEARGRAVATGDLFMRFGAKLGEGELFYYYPGYM